MTKRCIAIAAVPFSPNLGDGVIGECLRWGLEAQCPGLAVSLVDIAMRNSYAAQVPSSSRLKSYFNVLPDILKNIASYAFFGFVKRRAFEQYFDKHLPGIDMLVVGGGNIIADIALNFPLKLRALSRAYARSPVPCAIYSVGVAGKWSIFGLKLMRSALKRLDPVWISVRDKGSLTNWQLVGLDSPPPIHETWDPGVLCAKVWPRSKDAAASKSRVGIGVISAAAIEMDGNADNLKAMSAADYLSLASSLKTHNFEPVFFTNGDVEDARFVKQINAEAVKRGLSGFVYHDRPITPAQLVDQISACDVLVAYRLHAIIIAHSYAIPTIALEWDPKVRAFMQKAGRLAHSLPTSQHRVETIVQAVVAARTAEFSEQSIVDMHEQAMADIKSMYDRLEAAFLKRSGSPRGRNS